MLTVNGGGTVHGDTYYPGREGKSSSRTRSPICCIGSSGKQCFFYDEGAAPKQQTAGPKTLQAFVDGHWQLQFTVEGGVMCICCASAAQTDCRGVKRPPKSATPLVNGTYGMGMRMSIVGPKGWRKDVTLVCHVARPAAAEKLTILAATPWPPRGVPGCIVRNIFGHCAPVHLRVGSMWQRRALCSLGVRAWTSVYL